MGLLTGTDTKICTARGRQTQKQNKQDNWVYSQTLTQRYAQLKDRHKDRQLVLITDTDNFQTQMHSLRQNTEAKTEEAEQLDLVTDTDTVTETKTAKDRHRHRTDRATGFNNSVAEC